MKRAALDVIEAAYRTEGDNKTWLRSLARSLPSHPQGRGQLCLTYHLTERSQVVFDDVVVIDAPADIVARTQAMVSAMPPEYIDATWARIPCGTALTAGSAETRARSRHALAAAYGGLGIRDIVLVNGIDPTRRGVFLSTFVAQEASMTRRERGTWSRVAAHLASAYRLRRAGKREPDAVISPSGRVDHAVADASTTSAIEALRAAAFAIDKARTRSSRLDESEAVELWQALVAGRWTLVDHVDTDGKRYFIARKNDPEVARHHALTRRERQVVGFAALGHSNKLIAYEMGLSTSAVAVYLDIAMEKLGVTSRARLILAARAFGS